jgi:hypothetical protein
VIDKILGGKFTKLWFALSVTAFTCLVVSNGNKIGLLLNIPTAFALALFFEYKYRILDRLFEHRRKKYVFISLPIAIYTVVEIGLAFRESRVERILVSENPLAVKIRDLFPEPFLSYGLYCFMAAACVAALFFVFAATYAIVSRARKYGKCAVSIFKSADKIERRYIIIGSIVFSVFLMTIYNLTDIPYTTRGEYDIIFITDSPNYIKQDVFFRFHSPENDLRQPLFALLTMPFAVVAKILSYPLFFLPGAYILIMQIVQIIALLIMAALIARMLNLRDNISRIAFFALYCMSYPVLLFSFVVEQYIPSTFIVVLAIYHCVYLKKKNTALLALSSGTLLTNAAVVPFAVFERKLKGWFRSLLNVAVGFLVMCVFCGKLSALPDAVGTIEALLLRFGNIGINGNSSVPYDKLWQFTHFIANCFIAPEIDILYYGAGLMSFQLAAPSSLSVPGIVLAACVVIGILLNLKTFGGKMCGLWVMLATAILYVLGWGSPENGMILYSLYFGWAFFALVFMSIEKLPGRIKYLAYTAGMIVLAAINMPGIFCLIKFGIAYYPAR